MCSNNKNMLYNLNVKLAFQRLLIKCHFPPISFELTFCEGQNAERAAAICAALSFTQCAVIVEMTFYCA